MTHIFISYSRKETRDLARYIFTIINYSQVGITAWMDEEIPPGVSWAKEIDRQISLADIFLVLISPDVHRSTAEAGEESFVHNEILHAQSKRKRIIPVLTINTDLPLVVKSLQYIDLRERSQKQYENLDRALGIPPNWVVRSPSFREITVSRTGSADYRTITEALNHAPSGSIIRVRPGFYREALVFNNQVSLVADGPREDVVVESNDRSVVKLLTDFATMRGFTLRLHTTNRELKAFGVNIPKGRLHLEDCSVTSNSLACVGIWRNAFPLLRNCLIHDGAGCGILLYEESSAFIKDCSIVRNGHVGIEVREKSTVTIRNSKINKNQAEALWIIGGSKATIEGCDLRNNGVRRWRLDNDATLDESGNLV